MTPTVPPVSGSLGTRSTNLSMVLSLADSRLPTGGHVHSGGVEEAITAGLVYDLTTVEAFLRRRIHTSGAVAASVAAAVVYGAIGESDADVEMDARTPSPAARDASRAQGRGMRRLAMHAWRDRDWSALGTRPHLPVVFGAVGRAVGLSPAEAALVQIYNAMTGSAIAAQRLLALDPADVATCTFALTSECDRVATAVADALPDLAETSDPLLDFLAERHVLREMPLFVS